MNKKSITFAVALTICSSPVFAEMYRYVDENGQVVYSQFRPDTETAPSTVKAPPPPPSTAGQSRQQLIESLQRKEDIKEDMKKAEEKSAAEAAKRERQQKNCEAAKKNLEAYSAGPEKKVVDAEGNPVQLTDYQRNQEIRKAREVMAKECQ
jgi:hypothetical protein